MEPNDSRATSPPIRSAEALGRAFRNIDGRGYKSYKALWGGYDFADFRLIFEHIQADPYAAPSHLRIQVPATVAEIPRELYRDRIRRIALQDFLIRAFADAITQFSSRPQRGVIGGRQDGTEVSALHRWAPRKQRAAPMKQDGA